MRRACRSMPTKPYCVRQEPKWKSNPSAPFRYEQMPPVSRPTDRPHNAVHRRKSAKRPTAASRRFSFLSKTSQHPFPYGGRNRSVIAVRRFPGRRLPHRLPSGGSPTTAVPAASHGLLRKGPGPSIYPQASPNPPGGPRTPDSRNGTSRTAGIEPVSAPFSALPAAGSRAAYPSADLRQRPCRPHRTVCCGKVRNRAYIRKPPASTRRPPNGRQPRRSIANGGHRTRLRSRFAFLRILHRIVRNRCRTAKRRGALLRKRNGSRRRRGRKRCHPLNARTIPTAHP